MAMQTDAELFGLGKRKRPGIDETDQLDANQDPNAPISSAPFTNTPAALAPPPAGFERNWAGGLDRIGNGGNNSMTRPEGAFTNQNTPTTPAPLAVGGVNQSPAAPRTMDDAVQVSAPSQTLGDGAANQYGGRANLDPAYLTQQITASFQNRLGRAPTAQELAESIRYASTPDVYSDNRTRVGWNPYLEERMTQKVASADPNLAGDEGVLEGYGGMTRQGSMAQEQGLATGGGGDALASMVGATSTNANRDALNAWIQRLLGGDSPADAASTVESDPAVAAYKRVSSRRFADLRKQGAEDAALNGTIASGGFNGRLRGLAEDQANDVASYTGDRARQIMTDRRNEIMDAMRIAAQMGQFDQTLALQRELAKLNKDIADNNLGFNYANLEYGANRDSVINLLNG